MESQVRAIRVLQPFRRIRPTTNPYIAMLHRALEATPGVEPIAFSYRRAFFGRYDVVHLHWPETMLGASTMPRRFTRAILAHAYLMRLRTFRVPAVRTVHNLDLPAGLNPLEYAYLRGIDRQTSVRIHLNEATRDLVESPGPVVMIPHGHYRDWYAPYPRTEAVPGRVGFVGLIRRYKNVSGLVRAFADAREKSESISLHVAGNPSDNELASELRAAAGGDPAATFDLRFLEDADLVTAVTSCELLALPYHHMHNSGVVLTALSLDRPVLVPNNEATRAVRDEVGPGWVFTYDGELTGETLLLALDECRRARTTRPDLHRREWDRVGEAHRDAYLLALRANRDPM